MSVGDIRIADLFEAIGDALTLPPGTAPADETARQALLGHRIAAVCAAVDHVQATGDPIQALALLDTQVEAHPIAYTPQPQRIPGGGR
ncbi:hypothetical protein ABZ249_29190 [Nocardiopsis sp. NPDC006139]|uniref:hypothetical protein n=1 Tax=Nocardiopsis sp. NPDC006139 TaxID=3154578 RepID=UPI0033A4918B